MSELTFRDFSGNNARLHLECVFSRRTIRMDTDWREQPVQPPESRVVAMPITGSPAAPPIGSDAIVATVAEDWHERYSSFSNLRHGPVLWAVERGAGVSLLGFLRETSVAAVRRQRKFISCCFLPC